MDQDNDPIPVPKPTSSDPAIQELGEITDVNADVDKYITQKYRNQMIVGGLILLAAEVLWFIYIFASNNVSQGTLEVALIPVFFAVALFSLVKNKIQDAFFQQFAASNGFTFQKIGLPDNLDGSLFSIGHSAGGRDLVTGNFQNLPLTLFSYHYTIGYGKGARTYFYTIFRLDYPTPLPPIFLQVKGHDFGEGIFDHFSKNDPEKIQLEGDFNQYFTLYTKKSFETEALQVLSPDFMVKIQDEWKNFSLEFVGSHLYIYTYHVVGTKAELDSMYQLAQYLITRIEPMAARMKTTLTTLEGYYNGEKQ